MRDIREIYYDPNTDMLYIKNTRLGFYYHLNNGLVDVRYTSYGMMYVGEL
jgi:hypothetical protein